MSEELKPCPFCGEIPVILSNSFSQPFKVYCWECEIGQYQGFRQEQYAIEAWNRRA